MPPRADERGHSREIRSGLCFTPFVRERRAPTGRGEEDPDGVFWARCPNPLLADFSEGGFNNLCNANRVNALDA